MPVKREPKCSSLTLYALWMITLSERRTVSGGLDWAGPTENADGYVGGRCYFIQPNLDVLARGAIGSADGGSTPQRIDFSVMASIFISQSPVIRSLVIKRPADDSTRLSRRITGVPYSR